MSAPHPSTIKIDQTVMDILDAMDRRVGYSTMPAYRYSLSGFDIFSEVVSAICTGLGPNRNTPPWM